MMTFKQAQKYVTKPKNRQTETYENGDTQDIIETMLYAERQEQEQRFMQKLAPLLRGADAFETCRNVFDFVRSGLRYIADPRGHEKVKSSRQTLYSGYADCKSYSILICSLLRELGIKYSYRFVSWQSGRDVSHVYAVATLSNGSFEFPVALDAIPDSCGFDCEIKYAYKKDYDFMTKISYIDGVNAQNSNPIPPPQSPINWVSLTDGEAALALAKDRLMLLRAAHPDAKNAKTWDKAITWIDNAMFRGLHSGAVALPGGGVFASREEQGILRFMKSAQSRFAPAMGDAFAFVGRKNSWEGIRELGHVGDIPIEDCDKLCTYKSWSEEEGTYLDTIDTECMSKCTDRNLLAKDLMKIAAGSGHHFLYEYMTDAQLMLVRETKKYKFDNQTQVISKFADITTISRANVRELFKTEIMRKNNELGIGAMIPELAINELIKEFDLTFDEVFTKYPEGRISGIGGIGNPFFPVAFWIILACVAAIIAVAGLVQVIQGREPTAFDRLAGFTRAIINPTDKSTIWSPEGVDFKNKNITTCPVGFVKDANNQCIPEPPKSETPSWLLPVAAGGLVLGGLVLSSKSKK